MDGGGGGGGMAEGWKRERGGRAEGWKGRRRKGGRLEGGGEGTRVVEKGIENLTL